jgi:hypothetical protein
MTIINQTSPVAEQVLFVESYEKVEPEARALPAERVQKVNLDAAYAVTTALALIAGLRRFRGEIEGNLKDFDFVRFDKLEEYTKAFSVANARYSTATSPADDLDETYEEGRELRELLHADAVTLIGRGVLKSEALKGYTGLLGYKNVSTELQAVALLLSDNWEKLQGRCASSEAELERALRISQRLQLGAGEREVNPAVVAVYTELRNRMFTLFIEAYEDARSAIEYLRRHDGDADTIAPTLYTNKPSGRKAAKPENSAAQTVVPTVTPLDSPASATTTTPSGGNGSGKTEASPKATGPFVG